MSPDLDREYYWCLEHRSVEESEKGCGSSNRLGPYATHSEAERALATVAERNRRFDAEDEQWDNGPSGA